MEPTPDMVPEPSKSGQIAPPPSSGRRPAHGEWGFESSYAVGDVLGQRYHLLEALGEGGMGAVWRAHCGSLDIDVAVKVLHRNNGDENAAARLLREARATASLRHPAIVRTFDFGTSDRGEPFLVMELLEGVSLSCWLEEHGRMGAGDAVKVLLPIAEALSVAHAQGIVHRDVKPGNIIVKLEEERPVRPKIFDFGIAKITSSNAGILTQEGAVLGSIQYMSPEQANGDTVDPQTDVWAFCVVLYELITGKRPFDAPSLVAMLYAVHHCVPAPTTDFAAGDDALWQIIERGLRKSKKDRWSSMEALGAALASWALDHGITADAAGTSLADHWQSVIVSRPSAEVSESAREIVPVVLHVAPEVREPSTPSLRLSDTAFADASRVSGSVRITSGTCSAYAASLLPPPRKTRRLRVAGIVAVLGAMTLVGATTVASRADSNTLDAAASRSEPSSVPYLAAVAPVGAAPSVTPAETVPVAAVIDHPSPSASASSRVPPARRMPRAAGVGMPLPASPDF